MKRSVRWLELQTPRALELEFYQYCYHCSLEKHRADCKNLRVLFIYSFLACVCVTLWRYALLVIGFIGCLQGPAFVGRRHVIDLPHALVGVLVSGFIVARFFLFVLFRCFPCGGFCLRVVVSVVCCSL